MKRLLLIGIIGTCFGCASQKKAAEVGKLETSQSEISTKQTETYQVETISYGDTLQGESFIPLDDLNALYVESAGQKIEVLLKPVRDKEGKLTGHKAVFKTVAKPRELKKEFFTHNSAAEEKKEQKAKTENKTQQLKTGSGFSSFAWGAAITVFLLLLLVLWWLIKRQRNV